MKRIRIELLVSLCFLLVLSPFPASSRGLIAPPDVAETDYLGSILFPGDFQDVVYANGYLYLADGQQSHSGNLKVLDVSDPSDPQLVGSDSFPGDKVYRLALHDDGELLAAAVHGTGLVLYDLSQPDTLNRLSTFETEEQINDLVFSGDLLYVFAPLLDLTILDVTDPWDPVLISQTPISTSGCYAGTVTDNSVIAIADGSRLRLYDASDPLSISELDALQIDQTAFHEVTSVGTTVFAGKHSTMINSGGIAVVDVSDPQAIELVAQRNVFGADGPPNVCLTVDGDALYYTAGQTGLVIYDISDPSSPAQLSQTGEGVPYPPATGTWQTRVAAGDGLAFTLMPDRQDWYTFNNLWVLDVSDLSDPQVAGEYDTPDYVNHVVASGDVAYAGGEGDGLYTIDLSDPADPQLLGNVTFSELNFAGRQLLVSGDYVYVNGAGLPLAVVDVSVPDDPQLVSEVYTYNNHYTGLAKDGNLVVVSAWGINPMPPGWIELYDVSNPSAPILLSSLLTEAFTEAVAVRGNYAFLACEDGMWVVSVEVPMTPTHVATLETPAQLLDVVLAGTVLYACDEQGRLHVIDVTQPIVPISMASFNLPGTAVDLEVSGDSLWVTMDSAVILADISDPENLTALEQIPLDGAGQSAGSYGEHLLISDWYGVHVYNTSTSGTGTVSTGLPHEQGLLLQSYPNPFNAGSRIEVGVPQRSQVTVTLYNVLGQPVRRLYHGAAGPGQLELLLDGAGLASGTYFLRAESPSWDTASRTITLIK
ncbi:T9SS type A sorting domain-containing protein [bacterium]|nr:T9SS type A sorting domain-containing protein [bacterium]